METWKNSDGKLEKYETNTNVVAFKSNDPSFIISYFGIISIDEERNLFSFGKNRFGILGHDKLDVVITSPMQIPNVKNVKMVSCGKFHTCFIDYEGKVFSFGCNYYGELGIGKNKNTLRNTYIPQQIKNLPPIYYVSCGYKFTICVTEDKTAYSFGRNGDGQLGIGTKKSYSSPQLISSLTDIEFIKCGGNYAVCKTYSNEYYSWGCNKRGQLGQGNFTNCYKPAKCTQWPSDIIDIKCGHEHTLLLTSFGYIYLFGNNDRGKLGLGNSTFCKSIPTIVKGMELIKHIECGYEHSICVDINDNLHVFGNNGYGELGLGDKTARYEPTLNTTFHDIIDISSGGETTFVKTINNEIYAFGSNENAQLGIETSEKYQLTPIQVFKDNEDIWASNTRRSKQKSARN